MTAITETSGSAAARPRRDQVTALGLHPVAWAVWLASGLAMVFLTSDPLYVATIALVGGAVYLAYRRPERRAMDLVLAGGIVFAALTLPLNLLTGSSGATPLFHLPAITFPVWLAGVRLGGTVTAESLIYAAGQATGIAAIIALVCAFNVAVDHFRLLRLSPPGLAQLGIIVTVALLLVPETLGRAAALREARIVRGHHVGLGGLAAILLPLLAEALERSVQRAESLDARGFGRLSAAGAGIDAIVAVAGITVAAAGAFAYYYTSMHAIALIGVVAGAAVVAVVTLRQGRGGGAVRMRRQPLSRADTAAIAASAGALTIFAALRALGLGGLTYLPFPLLDVPRFDPLPAAACLLLVVPALFAVKERVE